MAFDARFAVVLVGSSGEGGDEASPSQFRGRGGESHRPRRISLDGRQLLKYGAAESSFGSKNASNLPVDSNELIALCAPRPTFISYGVPEMGDAKWLDQQGSFMATVASGPVFRLLGAKDLGVNDDYRICEDAAREYGIARRPARWRQHDAGHTDAPNWKYFIPWADKFFHYVPQTWHLPADQPVFRADANSMVAHSQLLAKAKASGIDVYFEGDSITRRWDADSTIQN